MPSEPPAPRMREYVRVLRAIWHCWKTGEKPAFEGEHYRFTLMTPNFAPEPIAAPPPAVMIAAVGPAMLKVAAEECDGVKLHGFCTRKYLTDDIMPRIAAGLAKPAPGMGFYVGYALSLFGRAQDRLSHVLVPPSLEPKPAFFYPRPGDESTRVYLGEIPFVRLRYGLPEHVVHGRARFSEAVEEAQKAVPLLLHLDPATRTVSADGKSFVLEPAQFAFYWMMAERCVAARGGAHWTDSGIAEKLLAFYGRVVNPASGTYASTERAYRKKSGKSDFKYLFDPPKTRVNGALRCALGRRLASPPYLIVKLRPIPGAPYHGFGLALPPEADHDRHKLATTAR
jgi:Luciferase-like monooxygenase/CRISPR-associated protein NE0113 (Cas_NE0113)